MNCADDLFIEFRDRIESSEQRAYLWRAKPGRLESV